MNRNALVILFVRASASRQVALSFNQKRMTVDVIVLKASSVSIIYVLAAIARLLYAMEGTIAHYTIHSDIPVSYFMSAGVGIVVAIALLLPLSSRLALLFVGISVVSGIIGFAEMSWIYVTEGETNPVTAPIVGAIVFSALLYLKPRLTRKV